MPEQMEAILPADGDASDAQAPVGDSPEPETTRLSSADLDLDRVIDVPLAVTLRFGQREMRLGEVLELNPGSLIELDRQIEEPVELLLGDRIIARGEVIIIDGNYGLRVTEIVSQASGAISA